jgi:hypothetical protein
MSGTITKSRARWALLPIALLVAAAGVALAASTAAGAQATTPRCVQSGLEVWLGVGNGGAQTGSIVYPMEFTNVSGHSCELTGYPGVSAWASGHQLGSAAGRDHSVPVTTVTLAAGATLHTLLQITDVSSFPATSCHPVTATSLTVYPPGAFTAADIPFRFAACSTAGPVYLHVQAVQPRVGVPGHPA